MVKTRLYDSPDGSPERDSAKYTLFNVLATIIKLFAPIIPYITEEIYQLVFKKGDDAASIHISVWPKAQQKFISDASETIGEMLIEIATAVRRYKSEKKIPMGSPLEKIKIAVLREDNAEVLKKCLVDIRSVTRAKVIDIVTAKLETALVIEEIS
jgi:valyl-tRNA synthetase